MLVVASARLAAVAAVAAILAPGPRDAWGQLPHGWRDGAEIPPKVVEARAVPPRGFELAVSEFAPPSMVGHPIGLAIDAQGRVYAAETNRYTVGVKESRADTELEDLELQSRDVAHFAAILREQLGKGKFRRAPDKGNSDPEYCLHQGLSEEVAVYEDRDGDGVAETRRVFAAGFDHWYSGPAADVFVLGRSVYLANIPDLWLLEDRDGDGVAGADERKSIAHGFGTVYSFLGHDLHGIVPGPDGRLYFSVGDRSFHVETAEGRVLDGKMGAVFRCNRDGSHLEIFATGLRNPQDLAFDARGDLMTGDNNCDKGDSARILRIVEGADFGWRLAPQRAESGGPWMRERMWRTYADLAGQRGHATAHEAMRDPVKPAWTLPPLAYPTGQGPSGACFYPGAGLPPRYDDHFFLTHCAGGGGFIQSFAFEDDGAGSKVVDFHEFLEVDRVVGPSDCVFGYDGRLYATNWGSGWGLNSDASIAVISHPPSLADPRVAAVRELFATGFESRSIAALVGCLDQFDHRVRLAAQFELVDRGDEGTAAFAAALLATESELARFHAAHGLAQAHRERSLVLDGGPRDALRRALADEDATVRAAAATALGDLRALDLLAGAETLVPALIGALSDRSLRVVLAAATALSKFGDARAVSPLLALADSAADRDAFLRHGVVLALAGCSNATELANLASHESRSIRLAAVLALRRMRSADVAAFLTDSDFQVGSEAARAIYDERLEPAFPALAAQLAADPLRHPFDRENGEAFLRRAVAIAVRQGGVENASRLIDFAATGGYPVAYRVFALDQLLEFDAPPPKDPVWFDWWPVAPREAGVAERAFREAQRDGRIEAIQRQDPKLRERARVLGNRLLPPRPLEEHLAVIAAEDENENVRLDSLRVLADRDAEAARLAIDAALRSGSEVLRVEARALLARLDPGAALGEIASTLRFSGVSERQESIRLLPRFFRPLVRYLRIELPGTGRILSLAEVYAWSDGENVAANGVASQSSTDWEGPPGLAIDGSIDADHSAKPAVSHTAIEDDPWFEIDFGRSFALDSFDVWNRTDHGHYRRLDGAIVTLLDEKRRELWRTRLDPAPEIFARFSLGLGKDLERRAARILAPLLRQLGNGSLDPALALEVLEAGRALPAHESSVSLAAFEEIAKRDALGEHLVALEGGDVDRGEEHFYFHAAAECLRCHRIEGVGGSIGPDLSGVGARRDRRYLLRSMLDPQATIVRGFGNFSAMPSMRDRLGKHELRDLVAFLAAQRPADVLPEEPVPIARPDDRDAGGIPPVTYVISLPPLLFLLAAGFVALKRAP
jgi:quinoprotein glucose dehydrogenase